jgi:hypothetical protein
MNWRAFSKQVITFFGVFSTLCGGWAWFVNSFLGLNQIASASVIALGSVIIGLVLFGIGIWLFPRDVDSSLVAAYVRVALEKCEEELAFHAEEMATEAGDKYVKACRYFERNIEKFIKQSEMRRKKDLLFLHKLDPADASKMKSRFSVVKDSVIENCRETLKILKSGTNNQNAGDAIAAAGKKIKSSVDTVQMARKLLE